MPKRAPCLQKIENCYSKNAIIKQPKIQFYNEYKTEDREQKYVDNNLNFVDN